MPPRRCRSPCSAAVPTQRRVASVRRSSGLRSTSSGDQKHFDQVLRLGAVTGRQPQAARSGHAHLAANRFGRMVAACLTRDRVGRGSVVPSHDASYAVPSTHRPKSRVLANALVDALEPGKTPVLDMLRRVSTDTDCAPGRRARAVRKSSTAASHSHSPDGPTAPARSFWWMTYWPREGSARGRCDAQRLRRQRHRRAWVGRAGDAEGRDLEPQNANRHPPRLRVRS